MAVGDLARGGWSDAESIAVAAALLLVILAVASLRIVPLYERVVVFRRGRIVGVRGPGVITLIPVLESRRTIDIRLAVLNVQPRPTCQVAAMSSRHRLNAP